MLETKDVTNKVLFQGEADQIQVTNLGGKDENTEDDSAKQNEKF